MTTPDQDRESAELRTLEKLTEEYYQALLERCESEGVRASSGSRSRPDVERDAAQDAIGSPPLASPAAYLA